MLSDYKESLYWHIRKIVISNEDADDVLQDTFIKVYENINKFKGKSNIYTWMYKISTNESLNFLGRKSRQLGISNEDWVEKQTANLDLDVNFDIDAMQFKYQKGNCNFT